MRRVVQVAPLILLAGAQNRETLDKLESMVEDAIVPPALLDDMDAFVKEYWKSYVTVDYLSKMAQNALD